MTDWIKTNEAMQLLGVSSTTVKRWADEGTLPSRRTSGGHRRFSRDTVDQLILQQPGIGSDSAVGKWIDLLSNESDINKIRGEIENLQRQKGDWYRAADFLEHVMQTFWNDLSNNDESSARSHIAAGRLGLSLVAISRSFAVDRTAPVVLVATFGGRQLSHRTGLIELCTKSEGYEVFRVQEKTSAKELALQIRSWRQRLVVLCAADRCGDCDLLADAYAVISAACKEQGAELAIGFAGNRPDSAGYGHYCHSFGDLKPVLRQLKPETTSIK